MPAYVAIGDSFTEGLCDELRPDGRHLGWADRVAIGLTATDPSWTYANLAVRGRLLGQVVAEQVPRAISLQPDLVSFHAGPNDVLRRGLDLDWLRLTYSHTVGRLRKTGADLVLFTVPGRGPRGQRGMAAIERRFEAFNEAVRLAAATHGAILVDAARIDALRDPRLWDDDRLHLRPSGHERAAAAVLSALGHAAPGVDERGPQWWVQPLPQAPPATKGERVVNDLTWARRHLAPWLWRRIRGVSSGDDVRPKHPVPVAVGSLDIGSQSSVR